MVKTVAIASDHAGYELKAVLHPWLGREGFTVVDLGAFDGTQSVDYPDFAARLARGIQDGEFEMGILVCGTGIGMAIMANRFPQVRAANCHSDFTARLAREHNDANVLTLGSRVVAAEFAKAIVLAFLSTEYAGPASRHQRRIDKLAALAPTGGK
jgi:ribose 5-phosphate isomerase B